MTLLSRLQDAPVGSQELDFAIYAAMRPTSDPDEHAAMWEKDKDEYWFWMSPAHYTTSLDAALALAERVLPTEWTWRVERNGFGYFAAFWSDPEYAPEGEAIAHTPALALCAAILEAVNVRS